MREREQRISVQLDESGNIVPPDGYATIKQIIDEGRLPLSRRSIQLACQRYSRRLDAERERGDAIDETPRSDEIACMRVEFGRGPVYWPKLDALGTYRLHLPGDRGTGKYAGWKPGLQYQRRKPREQDRRYRDVRERLARQSATSTSSTSSTSAAAQSAVS